MKTKQKVVLLAMGGTIAGKATTSTDNIGYKAAQINAEALLKSLSDVQLCDDTETEQVAQLDSKDMSLPVLAHLAQRVNHWLSLPEIQGVVITHGTDTIEETAFFLHLVCKSQKPIALTCAMRPATAVAPDGPQNLRDALTVVRTAKASGVVVVCAGRVHSAVHVQKSHTYLLDAFSSGDAGCVAHVEEGALRMMGSWPEVSNGLGAATLEGLADMPNAQKNWPKVDIVMNYAGATGNIVDALLTTGVQGIVVAGTGNGTVHSSLQAALERAAETGVTVVRSTRCANGRVLPVPGELFPASPGLNPVKARIALILALSDLNQVQG